MPQDTRAEALAFLRSHKAAVLASVSRENTPHASAIYYVADEQFNVYFLTLLNSRKFAAMQANPHVALAVGTLEVPQTLQMEGTVTELRNPEEMGAHMADLVKVLTSNTRYYAPITQLDPSETVLLWLKPNWVRWANYASEKSGSKNVLTEIPLA